MSLPGPSGPSVAGRLRAAATTAGWDLPVFAAATFVDQAGRLGLSLVAAAVLGPLQFGTWIVLSLVIQYAGFGGLGIPQGAGREIPRALGAGDGATAAATEDVAVGGGLVAAAATAVIAAAALPVLLGPSGSVGPVTIGLLAIVVFLQQLFLLEQVLFRSRLRFRPASVQLLVQGLAGPIVGLVLLAAGLAIDGLLGARVAVLAVALVGAIWTLSRVPRPRWDRAAVVALARIGAPLALAGFLFLALVTIDRWIVALLIGGDAVGWYGLVGLTVSGLLLLPSLVSQQFYPRLARARGAGADGPTLLAMARSQALLAGALTAGAAALAGAAAIVAIPALLPAYQPAVGPLLVALLGTVAYAFASADGNLLNLLDRQRRYVAAQLAALAVEAALGVGLVLGGLGIGGVAAASAVTMALYALGLRRLASRAARSAPPDRPIGDLPVPAASSGPPERR